MHGFLHHARPFLVALTLGAATLLCGQEKAKPDQEATSESDAAQTRLENAFRETLTGATLTGRWRTVRDGVLGEEREEKYSIRSATKTSGDLWIIVARVQYGEKDVTLPVPVRVRWAGDTPVISVTEAGLPGLGTYTARVLIYRDVYTGSWFGPNVTGTLAGTIRRDTESESKSESKSESESGSESVDRDRDRRP